MGVIRFDIDNAQLRARYDALFERSPAAYIQQSTQWAEVIADLGPDRPVFLLYENEGHDIAGLPLYLFEHELGNHLSSVPHAGPLGGPFFAPGTSGEERRKAYAALLGEAERLAQDHECLGLTLISNPFDPDDALYEDLLRPTYTYENFTQWNAPGEVFGEDRELRLSGSRRRSNLKRNLRKAREAGIEIDECRTDDDFEAVIALLDQRHRELGVHPLPRRMVENIRRVLVPAGKARLMVARYRGEIAAACVYIRHRETLDVLRLAVNSKFADTAPGYLLTEQSLLWAGENGVTRYNWQSSPSRASGVYQHKAQWGASETGYKFFIKLYCSRDRIRAIGAERLRAEYGLHFVVPYGLLSDESGGRVFRKD